jgi:hypothetical protein
MAGLTNPQRQHKIKILNGIIDPMIVDLSLFSSGDAKIISGV